MDSKKWKTDIREIKKHNDEIFHLKNGHWQVKYKFTILSKYASLFYDSHLDSIKKVALKVLSERHPMFDLDPEDRFVAEIYGKIPKYSSVLRKGIADTIAFLGVHGTELKNCTQFKPEDTASLTIRELFKEADWKLWASLNDLLPVLAESAPNEFLTSVENTLRQSPCPFDELLSQGDIRGITGINYMTSLYWALETLAWSEDYLSRTLLALAELATRNFDGRYADRAINSISTILLPWMPQTTAKIDTRIASLKGVQRNSPDIAWKTVISLLPNQHQVSTGSHKPTYRKFIPENWQENVPASEYWEQVRGYAVMAVDMAKGNISYVSTLAENLDNIPQPSFNSFLDYLSSDAIIKLPEEQKQPIWETMIAFIRKHRYFSDAKWALPPETVDLLQQGADKIAPTNPEYLYRPLFSDRKFYFFDRDVDRDTQRVKLLKKRIDAIKQIYEINKTDSIIRFAEYVENPITVGNTFAHIAIEENDNELLPTFLDSQEQYIRQFISGYIRSRYQMVGPNWIDRLHAETWSIEQKCTLLFNTPFEKEIWDKADGLLGDHVGDYWKKINANPFSTLSSLLPAIKCFLQYGRPYLALDCIYAHYLSQKVFFKEQAIKALIAGTSSGEPIGALDTYNVTEIIKMLQDDPQINEKKLVKIEWAYLPLLKEYNNVEPKLLEKQLSQKPELFIKVIKLVYRLKNPTNKQESDKERDSNALNAWGLLNEWKRPPGKMDDGSFSGNLLRSWYNEVKTKTIESGHYEVAMTHLGHVLFYTGSDQNGLWIHQTVAELLDEKDGDDMRKGFSLEVFNSRGVYSVDPSGKPEKELAALWKCRAEEIENFGLIRFASSLREIADSYIREAERVKSEYQTEQENAGNSGLDNGS